MPADFSEKDIPTVTIVQSNNLYKDRFAMSDTSEIPLVDRGDVQKKSRDANLDVYMQLMDSRKEINSNASDDDMAEDSSWSSSSYEKQKDHGPGSQNYHQYPSSDINGSSSFQGKNASQESLLDTNGRKSTSELLGSARSYNDYDDDDDEQNRSAGWLNNNLENGRYSKEMQKPIKWTCAGFFVIIVVAWLAWAFVLLILPQRGEEFTVTGTHYDFDDIFNSSFRPARPGLVWVQKLTKRWGFTYIQPNSGDIILENVEDQVKSTFVKADELKINNQSLVVNDYKISADTDKLMIWTNKTKQWRHSSFSNIYIFDLVERTLTPLNDVSDVEKEPKISYAVWSPQGHNVAYVMDNDLYYTDLKDHNRITYDGAATIFNGVPDWVYEEEVFGANFATWWSPDATHIAYLRFNETEVPEYKLPLYAKSNESYPEEIVIKYPKAGYPNPTVSLHIYSITNNASVMVNNNSTSVGVAAADDENESFDFADNDRLITQVVWTTTTHEHLAFKQTNRVQDHEKTIIVTLPANGKAGDITSKVANEYKPNDGGWVEVDQNIQFLAPQDKDDKSNYVDVADDGNGFMHLAMYSVKGDTEPTWLTSGEWEVIAGSVVVDSTKRLIHYISTEVSPLERHLYMLNISNVDDISKACITCFDNDEHGYFSASFSPKAGYYVLYYDGPNVPTTVVRRIGDNHVVKVLEENTVLDELLKKYDLPKSRMVTIKSGGIDVNAIEILPPDFDPSQKYPVLFRVYGGPGSQMASYKFQLDWHTFVASKLRYIVVMVDGRGTGFKGRKFRVGVRGRLGELETIDQVNAGRHWANLDYVDPTRLAIWGWSYGGFMTSKVVEADDAVFSVGMAVAPVTDWRFYDSVYTERYMLTPQLNAEGYAKSAVSNMTGFNNTQYLLVHGTGDDNVHFQNAAALIDRLTIASVHNYRVQFFTDSDHSINTHNANHEIYYLLTTYLWEGFGGEEYDHVRRETHGQITGPVSHH